MKRYFWRKIITQKLLGWDIGHGKAILFAITFNIEFKNLEIYREFHWK